MAGFSGVISTHTSTHQLGCENISLKINNLVPLGERGNQKMRSID